MSIGQDSPIKHRTGSRPVSLELIGREDVQQEIYFPKSDQVTNY
jgi:hypothetical protein